MLPVQNYIPFPAIEMDVNIVSSISPGSKEVPESPPPLHITVDMEQHLDTVFTIHYADINIYNQQMHNIFNSYLFFNTCIDALMYHHQGVIVMPKLQAS
jgi:hypothetical protein